MSDGASTVKPRSAAKRPRDAGGGGRRRLAIIRRATEIFGERGFAETTIEDIAGAVGFTREAVYYYFKDKTEILCEIIKPESEYLLWSIERINALSISAEHKLSLAIESHMMRFNPNYLEMAIALRELHGNSTDPRIEEIRVTWKRYERQWTQLVRDGQAQGVFDPTVDAKLTAFAILGMCNSPSGWFHADGGVSMIELVRTFSRLVGSGLVASTAPSG